MEKNQLPLPEMPAPPYPGPPLDYNAGVYPPPPQFQPQPQPQPQPQFQPQPQPQFQPQPQPQPQPQQIIQTVPTVEHHYQYTTHSQVVQPVSQVVVVQQLPTEFSGQMTCPHCQVPVATNVSYKIGGLAWLYCAIIALFLCWPCAFIPFCVNSCKDVVHSCPNCQKVLHIYKRT